MGVGDPSHQRTGTRAPWPYWVLAPAYLLALAVGAVVWVQAGWVSQLGGVPLGVVWAGAVGTVTRSLDGLFRHAADDWDRRYALWHITGPLSGAVTGLITYGILVAGLATLGGSVGSRGWGYFVAAFLTGYNNDRFRTLLAKAGTALFGTPSTDTKPEGPGVAHHQ